MGQAVRVLLWDDGRITVRNNAGCGANPDIAWIVEDIQPDEIVFLKDDEVIYHLTQIGITSPITDYETERPEVFVADGDTTRVRLWQAIA